MGLPLRIAAAALFLLAAAGCSRRAQSSEQRLKTGAESVYRGDFRGAVKALTV